MSQSNNHLFRCIDTLKIGDLSDETKTIMFVEYARLVMLEEKASEWHPVSERPTKYGKYEVYRAKCGKQNYETWNGTGWAYNPNDITHWRFIKPPSEFLLK